MKHPPVVVPAHALTSGALVKLGTCPRHGNPMVRTRQRRFVSKTPEWVILIVLLSLLIGLIVAVALQKKAAGLVPECASCVKDHGSWKRNTWIAWVGMLALFVLSGVLSSTPVLLLGLAALVAAIVLSLMKPRYEQTGTVSKDGSWLTLKQVDRSFGHAPRLTSRTPLTDHTL
jgi:hypothetical protein